MGQTASAGFGLHNRKKDSLILDEKKGKKSATAGKSSYRSAK